MPSKRLLRSHRRVRRIAVRGVPPAPSMYLARIVRLVEIEYDWEAALVSAACDLRPPQCRRRDRCGRWQSGRGRRQGRSFHRQAEAVVIKIAIIAVAYDAIRLTLPQ
jgi:hypothetical protein